MLVKVKITIIIMFCSFKTQKKVNKRHLAFKFMAVNGVILQMVHECSKTCTFV